MRSSSLLAGVAAFATTALAANSTTSNSTSTNSTYATFVYASNYAPGNNATLIWSMNAEQSTGDIYFHMEAPYSGTWAAVGFGAQMPGALMIVAYPSSNGTGVTVSPRIATTYAEPSYTKDIKIDLVWDKSLTKPNTVDQDASIMYVDGICRKCTTWNGGSLDLKNNAAPFIFAAGPLGYMQDDSLEAPLKAHSFYGGFTMDMTTATSQNNATIPNPSSVTTLHASAATFTGSYNNGRSLAHAGLMVLSWFILFPLGSLILRVFNKVILHAIVQCIGVFFITASFALGISVSKYYNRSKSFNSAHQIIGILLFAGLLVQLGLGIVGHRIFKKTNQPAKMMKVHVILGVVLIFAAVVNGGLGLNLSLNSWANTRYAILCVAIFIVFAALRLIAQRCVRRRQSRQQAQNQFGHGFVNQGVGPDGYQQGHYAVPKEPHVQSVPLRPYNQSTDSVPQWGGSAQQPRPMV